MAIMQKKNKMKKNNQKNGLVFMINVFEMVAVNSPYSSYAKMMKN